MINTTSIPPSLELYNHVFAGARRMGKSFRALAAEHGCTTQHAKNCLTGSQNGLKAQELRARLVKAVEQTHSKVG